MRSASTYRSARRNAVLRGNPRGVWEGCTAWWNVKLASGAPLFRYLSPPPVRANERDRSKD
jgi:hypothetical protein